ncbi:putative signal peptide protein [Puccinia sorghi]|uniref:Putative signal peptide protein n=1 Tax=Puccinia sorghi TaxID=27349 RepID=A0A0L6VBJ2_9BASI|nr:putative signal peptide protein [Puccinia sorghi]
MLLGGVLRIFGFFFFDDVVRNFVRIVFLGDKKNEIGKPKSVVQTLNFSTFFYPQSYPFLCRKPSGNIFFMISHCTHRKMGMLCSTNSVATFNQASRIPPFKVFVPLYLIVLHNKKSYHTSCLIAHLRSFACHLWFLNVTLLRLGKSTDKCGCRLKTITPDRVKLCSKKKNRGRKMTAYSGISDVTRRKKKNCSSGLKADFFLQAEISILKKPIAQSQLQRSAKSDLFIYLDKLCFPVRKLIWKGKTAIIPLTNFCPSCLNPYTTGAKQIAIIFFFFFFFWTGSDFIMSLIEAGLRSFVFYSPSHRFLSHHFQCNQSINNREIHPTNNIKYKDLPSTFETPTQSKDAPVIPLPFPPSDPEAVTDSVSHSSTNQPLLYYCQWVRQGRAVPRIFGLSQVTIFTSTGRQLSALLVRVAFFLLPSPSTLYIGVASSFLVLLYPPATSVIAAETARDLKIRSVDSLHLPKWSTASSLVSSYFPHKLLLRIPPPPSPPPDIGSRLSKANHTKFSIERFCPVCAGVLELSCLQRSSVWFKSQRLPFSNSSRLKRQALPVYTWCVIVIYAMKHDMAWYRISWANISVCSLTEPERTSCQTLKWNLDPAYLISASHSLPTSDEEKVSSIKSQKGLIQSRQFGPPRNNPTYSFRKLHKHPAHLISSSQHMLGSLAELKTLRVDVDTSSTHLVTTKQDYPPLTAFSSQSMHRALPVLTASDSFSGSSPVQPAVVPRCFSFFLSFFFSSSFFFGPLLLSSPPLLIFTSAWSPLRSYQPTTAKPNPIQQFYPNSQSIFYINVLATINTCLFYLCTN